MTALMFLSAVRIQLIVAVESLSTETTLGMPFESTLVNSPRIIVSELLVLPKLGKCEQLMFVREDFLVTCTKIAGWVNIALETHVIAASKELTT